MARFFAEQVENADDHSFPHQWYADAGANADDEAYMRLDPFHAPIATAFLGMAHYMLKQYSQALLLLRDFVSQAPESRNGHALLAATHAQLGQLEDARAQVAEVLRLQPNYTITGTARRVLAVKHPQDDKQFFFWVHNARRAQQIP